VVWGQPEHRWRVRIVRHDAEVGLAQVARKLVAVVEDKLARLLEDAKHSKTQQTRTQESVARNGQET
jgi:hypothetical protein